MDNTLIDLALEKVKLTKKAIKWIAENDNPVSIERGEVQDSLTVCLIADVFKLDRGDIADAILEIRRKPYMTR